MSLTINSGGALTIQGGSGAAAPTRHAIDANHVYVWHCGTGSTTGNNLLADVGGVNLAFSNGTQNTLAAQQYTMFRSTPSLVTTTTTSGAAGRTQLGTTSLSLGTGVSVSVEGILRIPSYSIKDFSSVTSAISLSGAASADQLAFVYRNGSNAPAFWAPAQNVAVSYGGGENQMSLGESHHVMLTWDVAASVVKCFIDGTIFTTFSSMVRSVTMTNLAVTVLPFGGSLAEIRISNIARSHAYAIEATRIMRSL